MSDPLTATGFHKAINKLNDPKLWLAVMLALAAGVGAFVRAESLAANNKEDIKEVKADVRVNSDAIHRNDVNIAEQRIQLKSIENKIDAIADAVDAKVDKD